MKLMKLFLLIFSILFIANSHIYSATPKVTYDYDGQPLIYHIYMSLQYGLGVSDYLHLIWPQKIHSGTDKTKIRAKLISFSNNLVVSDTYVIADGITGDSNYYITFGYQMQSNKWYQIQLYPNQDPTIPSSKLIQILTKSTYLADPIVYDSNYAFAYINIQKDLSMAGGAGLMTIATASTSTQKNRPSSIYTIDIDITPTKTQSKGGNFTLYLYYDSGNLAHNSGTTSLDFSFMGLCQSKSPSAGVAAAVLNYCQISSDLSTITFSLNSITASQVIRISTQVKNPLYKSVRGIRGYWVEFISGIVQENGYTASAVAVNAMAINSPGSDRVLLLWGIQSDFIQANSIPQKVPLFMAEHNKSNIIPYNSFNIGFQFSQTSPIQGKYKVTIDLASGGILEGSLVHNFPAYTGTQVFCHFQVSPGRIQCDNVGAFIMTNYRYFISGKTFFTAGGPASITTFGDIDIKPIVYDSSGNLLSVSLYTKLQPGTSMTVKVGRSYLDQDNMHNPDVFRIGNAQVVSMKDDKTLSSTANAMKDFFTGTNNTVGIVPDLGVSQQLVFLLQTTNADVNGVTQKYAINILYNSKVISFQDDDMASSRGLDFVGYENASGNWSISYSPCYQTNQVICQKYNNDTPTTNVQVRMNVTVGTTNNIYGLYKFSCGQSYSSSITCPGGYCNNQCNMFTGYSTSNLGSSVMSMRKVTFPNNYYSSLYADDNLLDFVITFRNNGGIVSTGLINAYTVVGSKMQNIKAAFVNYFDYTSSNYNKGTRIPMMLRIGGGVLPTQSRGATVIGVFFDDNVQARTFYTNIDNSYKIGCSTGNCLYYPNKNIVNPVNDNWLLNKRIQFYSIPAIQNQFNLLVPVAPNTANHANATHHVPPKYLTIGFFATNYTVGNVTGLLRTLSVYRLFGAAVTNSLTGAIQTINSLSRSGGLRTQTDSDFTTVSTNAYMGYTFNTTNVILNPPNNTFTYGYTRPSMTHGTFFGAGVTITSLYYNIFSSSTLSFEKPPSNTADTCLVFGYTYNQIITPGANSIRNKQLIYTVFCPIDSTLNLNSADANINFKNPQYPNVFTNGFPLQSILTYGYSDQNGHLRDFKRETSAITTLQRSCTTFKTPQYMPSTDGKQRSIFSITTPQIRLDKNGFDGYPRFRVLFLLPNTTVTSNFQLQSDCEVINEPYLTCTYQPAPYLITPGTYEKYFQIKYTGNTIYTITSFSLNLYGVMATAFGAAANYVVTIYLPQYYGQSAPFGDPTNTNAYTPSAAYCQCQSTFTVGITGRGKQMVLQNLNFQSGMKNVRSYFTLDFGASSYRQTFFSSSSFVFDFGFLTSPMSTYNTRGDFRCIVYQNANSTLTISRAWKTLSLSNLNAVSILPKEEIPTPNSIKYTLKCFGTGVPSSSSGNLNLSWKDNAIDVQIATAITPITYVASSFSAFTLDIDKKRFRSQGFKAYYTFKVVVPVAMTQSGRFYFDFHSRINSKLDLQGNVQCYTRTASLIDDSSAIFTYCEFITQRQLSVWNNVNLAAGNTIYIDVFNIQQPKQSDISASRVITCTIDQDDTYSNGVTNAQDVADNVNSLQPINTAISKISILDVSVDNSYIRSTQTLTIKIDMNTANVFNSGKDIYLQLPFSYAQWIKRADTISTANGDCSFTVTNAVTNYATACKYISKRLLKLTIGAIAGQLFTIIIKNLKTPSYLPAQKNNQYRFNLFCSDASQGAITYYTFADFSSPLTLVTNDNLQDLSWKYYSFTQSNQLINFIDQSNQALTIFTGYYSSIVQLRQQKYPSNFQTSMTLTLSNFAATDFLTMGDSFKIDLGKSAAYFRIAANINLTPGLYSLQFNKAGDVNSLYTAIPPMTLVVNNKKCSLATQSLNYLIPIGGSTLPIIIKGLQCIPVADITVGVTSNYSNVVVDTDLSSLRLTKTVIDGNLYIILKNNGGSPAVGSLVSITFSITGTNAAQYNTIPSITLTFVDPSSYQTIPVATSLNAPTLNTNMATFRMQCSQASTIFWGLGIYPSILNTQALDFQARIISTGSGLTSNFTQQDDYYKRVYGINPVSTMQVLSKNIYFLKSNTNYIFKYYCKNQMGLISDGQSVNFTSLNYGAYLMKVSITFRNSITYGQYHDLSCSLAENVQIPYARVMTEVMSYCNNKNYIFYSQDSSIIANEADSSGQYIYNFYILPDYTIPADTTNVDIRNSLSLHSFTSTIITKTANYLTLPEVVQMQTQDIQVFSTPTLSIQNPIAGLNSIMITASITNMNGFIIIGVMNGVFDNATMTLPTTNLIKRGLFQQGNALVATKMQYTTQNYNVTFQISSLTDNKEYTLFYFATSEDPTFLATASAVKTINAKTLQALSVNINWQHSLSLSLIVLLLGFLLLG